MPSESDSLRFYEVRLSEPAEIEIDAEHTRLRDLVSPDYADRWRDGLIAALDRLSFFPTSHEVAPENDLYGVEVRRMLYHGPARRRGGPIYRILFYIIEPAEDDLQGLVRVLHVWHGAKRPLP